MPNKTLHVACGTDRCMFKARLSKFMSQCTMKKFMHIKRIHMKICTHGAFMTCVHFVYFSKSACIVIACV